MSKNSEALNRNLYELLRGRGYKPSMLTSAGKPTPVPEEANVFQFNFIKDGKDYGKVSATIDGDNKLVVYYGDDVADSPDTNTSGTQYSDSWSALVRLLSSWRFRNGLRKFDLENEDHLESDMARREHVRKQEQIAEGYYAMGKKASYSDSVPTVKMVIQHSRQIEEGEQRYRNVARIFLENQEGERFLAPTTKPGIAKVYARHIAEGGKPHDDRWNHIGSLCEEYQKMAGFVRATRGQQFNESAQQLVESGINHYNSLRESLGKMTGHRGYNMYFESWSPPLMEDETDTTSINELFVQETLDPRIESVMPILSKLHKQVSEMSEVTALSEWADSLIEGDGGQEALNPIGIPEGYGEMEESVDDSIDAILAQHPEAVENFKQGGDLDYDLESDLWSYYFNQGDIKNYDADASEYIGQRLADYLGVNEEVDTGEYDARKPTPNGKEVDDAEFQNFRAKLRQYIKDRKEEDLEEGLDADQKRAGQWGPTGGPATIGDLVGENFINTDVQAVVSEMDSEGYTGSRDDYKLGGPEKTLGPESMMKAKELAKKGIDILSKSYKDADNKKDMKEGEGNFAKAIEKLHGWYQHDSSDPDVEIFDFDDGEGGYYAQGTIEHNLKTGEINVEFEDTSGEYGGGSIKEKFNSIGDAMNVLRGITSQMRYNSGRKPKFDTLSNRTLAGSDDVYKTDRAGKKGTLSKARMDTMKASSPYRMQGGPKGVLPEGQEDLDTIRRLLGK